MAAPFKAIIVGGGPVGITAAHALHHAGIDFVVLERRRDVLADHGASLNLSPQTLRVFHQFGLLHQLQDVSVGFRFHATGSTLDGKTFTRDFGLSNLVDQYGSTVTAFHRADLVTVLYNGLPDEAKAKYHNNKEISDISIQPDGVEVKCSDGTSYAGSIVIGADGVYSKTRSILRRLALESEPSLASSWDPDPPYTAYFRCLWSTFPRASEPGESYETQGNHRSVMYLSGKDKSWIFLYEKLDKPTTEKQIYSTEDARKFAETFADWQANENSTVGELLLNDKSILSMGNLYEGLAKNVSWAGRIVLVGDARLKYTPNSGIAFNNGVQDVVSLSNHLVAALRSSDAIGPDDLQTIFHTYQKERQLVLEQSYEVSGRTTRLSAWATTADYLKARYFSGQPLLRKLFVGERTSAENIKKGIGVGIHIGNRTLFWDSCVGSPAEDLTEFYPPMNWI